MNSNCTTNYEKSTVSLVVDQLVGGWCTIASLSLCRFSAACRIRISEMSDGFTFDYHLRALPFFSAAPEIQSNGAHESLVAAEVVCLALLPGKGRSKTTEHSRHILQFDELEHNKSTGVICPIALTEYGNSTKFGGRIVDTEVDFELLRGWINIYQENHTKTLCTIRRKMYVNLQPIDCERKLMVKTPPGSVSTYGPSVGAHNDYR